MKKTLSIFVMLTLVSSVVFAGGIEDPKASSKVAVMKKDNDHVKLFYKGIKSGNVEVFIYDADNVLKFSEVIRKSDGFSRPYDFSNLKPGIYTIVVKDGEQSFTEKINTLPAVSTLLSNVIKVKDADNRYVLTMANNAASKVNIRVTDNNKVIYEKVQALNGQASLLFNFPSAKSELTFAITDENGKTLTFTK